MNAFVLTCLALSATGADVTYPQPGITLVKEPAAALVIADLCSAGVSVRATKYAERKATPGVWAQKASVNAEVAINADFFDFPAATLVVGRARGDSEDWPADKQQFEVRSYFRFGSDGAFWQPDGAVTPPGAPTVTDIVAGHNTLISGGVSHAPGFDGDPTITKAHRRTAVGLSADRRWLYVFVSDTALTGTSVVSKMQALATAAGAPAIHDASNLDGGGSSQLYVKGPGALFTTGRLVANHLGIRAKGSGPAPQCPKAACVNTCSPSTNDRVAVAPSPTGFGYWIASANGAVLSFGNTTFRGSLVGAPLNKPIVAMMATPSGLGYWMVASDGGVFSFGDAGFHGSMGGTPLNAPIRGAAATPSGGGYWLVASDGGIFAFGDAGFHGSMGGTPLNAPVVAMAPTKDGGGYWLVAADGGIFSFGNAGFHGSMGGEVLNAPIVGMARTPAGGGYWLVGSDGGMFAFGNAGFYGSAAELSLNQPIVAMAAPPSGGGYWLFAADGGVFSFGSAPFLGSGVANLGCDGATPLQCVSGADGCFTWSPKAPCEDTKTCRNGQCEPACVDACQSGGQSCDGAAVLGCGNIDTDPCLDWTAAIACPAGKSCTAGSCQSPACADECLSGSTRCAGDSVEHCVSAATGCTVWAAGSPCGEGQTCEAGACVDGAAPPEPEETDVGSSADVVQGPDTVDMPDTIEIDEEVLDIDVPTEDALDVEEPLEEPDALAEPAEQDVPAADDDLVEPEADVASPTELPDPLARVEPIQVSDAADQGDQGEAAEPVTAPDEAPVGETDTQASDVDLPVEEATEVGDSELGTYPLPPATDEGGCDQGGPDRGAPMGLAALVLVAAAAMCRRARSRRASPPSS